MCLRKIVYKVDEIFCFSSLLVNNLFPDPYMFVKDMDK